MSAQHPYDILKRTLDVSLSGAALLLTAPVQGAVAALVAHDIGRPVLFRQERPGRRGKPFVILKFRTMREMDPQKGLITDRDRLTPFGRLLRSTSLDELPSLWNVFKGDMSLVGPRPLLMQYLPLYTERQFRRHEVRPGLTGMAQVSGRNAVSWEERFDLDVEYVDRRSLLVDLRILLATIRIVVRRDGIAESGEATMTPFSGSPGTDI